MPLFKQKLHSSVFNGGCTPANEGLSDGAALRDQLSLQGYLDEADIGYFIAFFSSWQFGCSYADAFDFYVGQETASDDFCDVYGAAYGFSACFYIDLFRPAVKESDAGKHVVHDWFGSDKHCVVI
jgi:hypothetical protein